jgi:hypothetical protein
MEMKAIYSECPVASLASHIRSLLTSPSDVFTSLPLNMSALVSNALSRNNQFTAGPKPVRAFSYYMNSREIIKILAISTMFSLIVGVGTYGFGTDYYASYINSNISWGSSTDQLGWMLATMTVNGIHLGVYITSFLLAFSTGLIVFSFSEVNRISNGMVLLISYIILLHTWPIIMSTSNVMRQGVMMSFVFMTLYFYLSEAWLRVIIFALLAFFSHKSAVLFVGIMLMVRAYDYVVPSLRTYAFQRLYLVLIPLFSIVVVYVLFPIVFGNYDNSRIIGRDFRYLFLSINVGYIFYFFLLNHQRLDVLSKFLFFFSMLSPTFLALGFNSQFERINMVMLIPYILTFSRIFPSRFRGVYLLSTSSSLLFLTIFAGMYASLR